MIQNGKIFCGLALVSSSILFATTATAIGQVPAAFPEFAQVRAVIDSHFQTKADFHRNDLITRGDVAAALRDVEALGWKDVSRSEAVSRLVDDGEFLARELRSNRGEMFMRRVSGYRLIYDRLDRITRMPGGHALLHDLIKLPDGHRYARMEPGRGVPSLTDFLPKGESGKTPRVTDLDKPTGRAYTLDEFLKQLEVSHRSAKQAAAKS